jgi:maleate cis-trans isomerase
MSIVGVIKPSTRPGRAEELVAILPKEIELVHAACRIAHGTIEELRASFADFEREVAAMAALRVDLIHPAGVPFLLLGFEGEHELVLKWQDRHNIPIFTNGMSQVSAARAFGAKRLLVASYFAPPINQHFAKYLEEAGFEVLAIVGLAIDFREVPKVDASVLRSFFDALFEGYRDAEALYLIGPAWRATLYMLDELEAAYGIPVIHHVPAQSWEIQKRLGFRRSFDGYGRLIREMPLRAPLRAWPE